MQQVDILARVWVALCTFAETGGGRTRVRFQSRRLTRHSIDSRFFCLSKCLFVHIHGQDWSSAKADACVLAAAPFHSIVMSDVIYEEEIVEMLVHTLRRLCHLHLQTHTGDEASDESDGCAGHEPSDQRHLSNMACHSQPAVYLCASHRTERVEDLFFTALAPWFTVTELTSTVNGELRRLLNRDAIAIWKLDVRPQCLHRLAESIPELRPAETIPELGPDSARHGPLEAKEKVQHMGTAQEIGTNSLSLSQETHISQSQETHTPQSEESNASQEMLCTAMHSLTKRTVIRRFEQHVTFHSLLGAVDLEQLD